MFIMHVLDKIGSSGVRVCVCVFVCVYPRVCVYVCMQVYANVYVCIYRNLSVHTFSCM